MKQIIKLMVPFKKSWCVFRKRKMIFELIYYLNKLLKKEKEDNFISKEVLFLN